MTYGYGTEWVGDEGFFDVEQFGEDAFLLTIFDEAQEEFKNNVVQAAAKEPTLFDKIKETFGGKSKEELLIANPLTDKVDGKWFITDKYEIQSSVRAYQSNIFLKLKSRADGNEKEGVNDLSTLINYVTGKLEKLGSKEGYPITWRKWQNYIGKKIDDGELPAGTLDPRPVYRRPKVQMAGLGALALGGAYYAYSKNMANVIKTRNNPYGLVWFLAVPLVMGAGATGWTVGRVVTGKKILPDEGFAFETEETKYVPPDPLEAIKLTYEEQKSGYLNNVDIKGVGEAALRTSVWNSPTSEKIAFYQAAVFLMVAARWVKSGGDSVGASALYDDATDMFSSASSATDTTNVERIGSPLRQAWESIYMADPIAHPKLVSVLSNVQSHMDAHGIKYDLKWKDAMKEAAKDNEHGKCLAYPTYYKIKFILGGDKPSCVNDKQLVQLKFIKYGLYLSLGLVALSYVRPYLGGSDSDDED